MGSKKKKPFTTDKIVGIRTKLIGVFIIPVSLIIILGTVSYLKSYLV